jgi:hypothetical protein
MPEDCLLDTAMASHASDDEKPSSDKDFEEEIEGEERDDDLTPHQTARIQKL